MKSNNIILLGYKGVGKTTLGEKLANRIGFTFLDLDHYFRQTHNIAVKTYVARYGMQSFRIQESNLIQTLELSSNRVIACGGGVVDCETNIRYLKTIGSLILLDLAYAPIFLRLQKLGPLPEFVNEKHYRLRRRRYFQAAEHIYSISGLSVEDEVQLLQQFLRGKMNGI